MGLGRGDQNLQRLDVLVSFHSDRFCSSGYPWGRFFFIVITIMWIGSTRTHQPLHFSAAVAIRSSNIRIVRDYLL